MKIPLLQSKMWQKLQDDLGENSTLIREEGYHFLAINKSTPIGNYFYVPYGPVASDKKSFKSAINKLVADAKKSHAIFIRIEPQNPDYISLLTQKYYKSTDLNPKETWVLDLSGTDENLKSRLPSRLYRYYKSAPKKGISIETSHDPKDIKHLLSLQKSLASQKGISTFSEEYLKTELRQPFATLYLVRHQENNISKIISAGLVFDDDYTRYNLQGAQDDLGRKLHATGILTIKLILDAKAKNLQNFDFWGIAPENAPKNHPWAGFTAFKKTFEGQQVNYAGTYDIVINPTKYRLYQFTRKLNRIRRKI